MGNKYIIKMCKEVINGAIPADLSCAVMGIKCENCPFSWHNNKDETPCMDRDNKENKIIAKRFLDKGVFLKWTKKH